MRVVLTLGLLALAACTDPYAGVGIGTGGMSTTVGGNMGGFGVRVTR